jgi:hypothetical protein
LSILPVGISLLSLVLSVYGVILSREAPDIVMTMPDRVRVVQGSNAAWLYLQPRFVNTGGNQRIEVIGQLAVQVASTAGGTPVPFGWDEQGTWLYDTQNYVLTWQFVADPAPLVVGPGDPQFPTGLFIAPAGWLWQPGTYRVTAIAERTVNRQPIQESLEFALTQDQVDFLATGSFLEIPASPPTS